jgi:hypothetical protein
VASKSSVVITFSSVTFVVSSSLLQAINEKVRDNKITEKQQLFHGRLKFVWLKNNVKKAELEKRAHLNNLRCKALNHSPIVFNCIIDLEKKERFNPKGKKVEKSY